MTSIGEFRNGLADFVLPINDLGVSKMTVLLITRKQVRDNANSITSWSGIFADGNTQNLNETEKNVLVMISKYPDCWNCGCVSGYPESKFSKSDRENLQHYGIGNRFSM